MIYVTFNIYFVGGNEFITNWSTPASFIIIKSLNAVHFPLNETFRIWIKSEKKYSRWH